jgi:hypothetical protein
MRDKSTAVEELKLLQEVISRHENHAMRIKGWLFLIVAGLATALYSQGVSVSKVELLIGAIAVTFLFLIWELHHRALVQMAISRASKVEEHLRDSENCPYDGPCIGTSLSSNLTVRSLLVVLCHPWNWSSLVVVVGSLTFLVLFAPLPKATPSAAKEQSLRPMPQASVPASPPSIPGR